MLRITEWLILAAALLACAGCATTGGAIAAADTADAARGPVYAYVNDQPVYAADIVEQVNALPPYQRQQLLSQPERLQSFIDDFLTARLVADAAREAGMETSDTYQRKLRAAADELLVEQYMQLLFTRVAPPTDTEVAAYYHENINDFTRPAAVRAQFIQANDSATADKAYREARGGADFAALQAKYSTSDDSLTVLQLDNLPPGLRAAFAALPVNGILPPFPTGTSIYVFRKQEDIPLQLIPFSEIRDRARQAAYRERVSLYMTAYLENLKRERPFRVVGSVQQLGRDGAGDENQD